MKASATALFAGGRGNELLIQVYICRFLRQAHKNFGAASQ